MKLFNQSGLPSGRPSPANATQFGRRLAMAASTPAERRAAHMWTAGDQQATAAFAGHPGANPTPRKHPGPAAAVAREARRLHECSEPARAPSARRIQDMLMLVAALSLSAGLGYVLVDLAARFAIVAAQIAMVQQ